MRRVLVILLGLLLTSPTWADIESDKLECINGNDKNAIDACGRLLKSGRFDQGVQASIYYNRGINRYNMKQYHRAIQDFNAAIRLKPKYAHAYNNRGYVYYTLEQYRRAIQDFNAAIRYKPNYADAFGNRGLSYEFSKQKQLAISDYRTALRLRPGDRVGTEGLNRLGAKP